MTRSARLLELLSLLQARRDWPGQLLAQRLGVSPRTVRRDVERLRDMDYRVVAIKGPDGGYRLDAGSELPPLLFDDGQAVALAIALQLATASGVDIADDADRALATVRQVMPARLRHRLDTLQITTARPPDSTVDRTVLTTVTTAVRNREQLRFDYGDPRPDGAQSPRHVEPHHVVAWRARWYLVAWDLDQADWRTFRLDRLAPRAPNGPRFTPRPIPGDDVATFVAARFKGSDTTDKTVIDAWPCIGEVVLALPAEQVSPFAGDGVVEDLGADGCRLVQGSWSWPALAASIGLFDAEIRVVGPPTLHEAFALLADRYSRAAAHRT